MSKVYRCVYDWTNSRAGACASTFHVVARPSILVTDSSAADVRDDLHDALSFKFRDIMWSGCTLVGFTVTEELAPDDTSPPDTATVAIGLAGTQSPSTENLPASAVLCASLRTNAAVRSGHGRQFVPITPNENLLADGRWDLTNSYFTGRVKTYLDELIAGHQWGTITDPGRISTIVYSRTRRARAETNYYFDVTAHVMRSKVSYLRSRSQP